MHCFHFINNVALNKSSQDELRVSFLEHWEVETKGEEVVILNRFSWVTDLEITPGNVIEIMRCGRARWRIENETFNTLKNQGYNLGHNYGLGKKHLSAVFMHLMMLAFFVDCPAALLPSFSGSQGKTEQQAVVVGAHTGSFPQFYCPVH